MAAQSDKQIVASDDLRKHMPTNGNVSLSSVDENMWIEVIQKMDGVYGELVESQIGLEEKHAQLKEAQNFIVSVISSMTDVLIACDVNGQIQQVNQALLKLTGHEREAISGQLLDMLFHEQNKIGLDILQKQLADQKAISDFEIILSDKQNEAVPLSVNCSARFDHKDQFLGMVFVGRPVGELQRAYKELDKAHQSLRHTQQQLIFSEKMAALGRLVAGVAHELNNPISFIFGNMFALKNYGEKITNYLKAIKPNLSKETLEKLRVKHDIDRITDDIMPLVEGTLEGTERVRDIVQELRRFSGTQKEPREAFLLKPAIETAINWAMRAAKTKPKVSLVCSEDLHIISKRGFIHQIIVNLVRNGIDALEGQNDGQLEISAIKNNHEIIVKVSDNGAGIAKKDIAQIFEPFYTTKPIGQGTGLGLYISYGMAEELGGHLKGENRPKGGARFILTVPCAPMDEELLDT